MAQGSTTERVDYDQIKIHHGPPEAANTVFTGKILTLARYEVMIDGSIPENQLANRFCRKTSPNLLPTHLSPS